MKPTVYAPHGKPGGSGDERQQPGRRKQGAATTEEITMFAAILAVRMISRALMRFGAAGSNPRS